MNKVLIALIAFALAAGSFALQAGGDHETVVEEKIVIALNTDDFELEETDLSHLAVGDAETIMTESGKTVDLLRTEDGIEIYVDGELMDMPHMGAHGGHKVVHAKVEVTCDDEEDEECNELVWITEDGEINEEAIRILHEKHGGDIDIEVAHEGHHGMKHKVIVIESDSDSEDIDGLHEPHEGRVIVIRKKTEETL